MEFFLQGGSTELDNPAKPVLDTLFAPRSNPNQEGFEAISGIVFDVDDSAVVQLNLRKTMVTDPELVGATIVASWVLA